jgi:8-oxo-dGTP pyrophosphatase MutT (NUDIX family)
VVVARPDEDGVEVLALRRSAGSRFAPGFVVFPGGAIEPEDAGLALRLFGDAEEAARACALRELYEEAGLLLTTDGLEARPERAPIEDVEFVPPRASTLMEMARWIAPEQLEVRFDARFFSLGAPKGIDPTPDEVEVEQAWWARPLDLLEENRRGSAPLMWPTLVTLHRLAECRTVEEVLDLRVEQVPPR